MNIAVIFAGGCGSRMNSKGIPKQFLVVSGKPIIIHTLEYFERNEKIDAIVIACIEGWHEHLKGLIDNYSISKVKKIVFGGSTGQKSIYNALIAAKEISGDKNSIVLIHDGVRPMITQALIDESIKCVEEYGSAITSAPLKETLLITDRDDIENVPDRQKCRLAKAPQSFYLRDILDAHNKAIEEGREDFIDSCTMMSHYGYKMHIVEGPIQNIKITTAEDFYLMRAMLNAKEDEQIYGIL